MLDSWQEQPKDRPTFSDIKERLNSLYLRGLSSEPLPQDYASRLIANYSPRSDSPFGDYTLSHSNSDSNLETGGHPQRHRLTF